MSDDLVCPKCGSDVWDLVFVGSLPNDPRSTYLTPMRAVETD